MLDWKSLHQTIDGAERILLSTHENPDGDGLGSAAAVYHYLNSQGKNCKIINISDLPLEYEFLNQNKMIETYNSLNHTDWIASADLALIFDVGDYSRLGIIGELLNKHKIHVVNIDHHPDLGNGQFSENYINVDAAATGEMAYDFLKAMNIPLSKEMAEGIYTGVMTDTGSFCYNNTNEKCHQIAIECMEAGVNTSLIYQTVYENRSPGQIALLAQILNNLDYDQKGELAWFTIDKNMMDKAGATKKDIDGFTDFVRSIRGVEVAVMIFQNKPNSCRINFRSKGKYIINDIAKSLGGGGHKFAAGAIAPGTLNEVLQKVLSETKAALEHQNGHVI